MKPIRWCKHRWAVVDRATNDYGEWIDVTTLEPTRSFATRAAARREAAARRRADVIDLGQCDIDRMREGKAAYRVPCDECGESFCGCAALS